MPKPVWDDFSRSYREHVLDKKEVRNSCLVCGKVVDFPRKCSYCKGIYCDEHGLPELHNCKSLPARGWAAYKAMMTGDSVKTHTKPYVESSTYENTSSTTTPVIALRDKIKRLFSGKNTSNLNKYWIISHVPLLQRLNITNVIKIIWNIIFLVVVSLPFLDSLQLIWDSPLSFSRTLLPKWWALFPSEYPVPSINLLYVYLIMAGIFCITIILFIYKMRYNSYDPRKIKIRHYFYVIIIGAIFLYFFAEARFLWIHSFTDWISTLIGVG